VNPDESDDLSDLRDRREPEWQQGAWQFEPTRPLSIYEPLLLTAYQRAEIERDPLKYALEEVKTVIAALSWRHPDGSGNHAISHEFTMVALMHNLHSAEFALSKAAGDDPNVRVGINPL